MKIELKHLAPYLPYGLRIFNKDNKGSYILSTGSIDRVIELPEIFKPILRPLSDLTDPLINLIFKDTGENGIIISRYISDSLKDLTITITYKIMGDVFTDFVINRNDIRYTDYWIVEKLFENHFDVFGLIDKGLAIDINTIKQ
tara:strand:+ start:77 stop:505 length:429 start_codon:yes stop_codon:yes gene_type:complete